MAVRVERLTGTAIEPALMDVARLRIAVFGAFPYLYKGSLAYERDYLSAFAAAKDAILVAARDGEAIVGASTGLPLVSEHEAFREPVRRHGIDPAEMFYCAESVLAPAYRGRGLGHAFFDIREDHARRHGFRLACFCSVVRAADDPRRPADYRPLDEFWRRRGYAPVPGLHATYSWRDRGEAQDTPKQLQYWLRDLTT